MRAQRQASADGAAGQVGYHRSGGRCRRGFVPLATVAYETIPREQTDAASGIFNLFRTIGSSIGISW